MLKIQNIGETFTWNFKKSAYGTAWACSCPRTPLWSPPQ